MKEKIKNLFCFLGHAWSGGGYGKLGVIFTLFACFTFVGLFWGDVSIQRFTMNIFTLNRVNDQLVAEQQTLDDLNRHIKLLQNASPDYIEELGLKYLNMGTPDTKILKI
ncbi:MAG: hypothetical protein IKW57_00135 [Alphaproteobacteria bacterium]|nr:hypothetical protein [Alphaproteobacteria bacterium]